MTKQTRKLLLWGLIAAAALFALQGGQYSTLDLLRHRAKKAQLTARIDSLIAQVDSLEAYQKMLRTDPREQERVARELWGYVMPNEILYRIDR